MRKKSTDTLAVPATLSQALPKTSVRWMADGRRKRGEGSLKEIACSLTWESITKHAADCSGALLWRRSE